MCVDNSSLDDGRLDSFETCRADKKLWNKKKSDYKNCASRWSLTHCNMMNGTHNVTLTYYLYDGPKWPDSGQYERNPNVS